MRSLGSVLVSTLFLLSACKEQPVERAGAPASPVSATAPAEAPAGTPSALTLELRNDAGLLALFEDSASNLSDAETKAVAAAREKIALVQAAQLKLEQEKKTALDAQAEYGSKFKSYQQALQEAESARQLRSKAMSALQLAQKELDAAWAGIAGAREAFLKTVSDPRSTPEQKGAAEAALARAQSRAEQANTALSARTKELESSQAGVQGALVRLTLAAEGASLSGADYAAKAAAATRATQALAAAVSEEKKAMAVIAGMNQARARVVAELLEKSAHDLVLAQAGLSSAREAQKQAAAKQLAAGERLKAALKDAEAAKAAADAAAVKAGQAAAVAQERAAAKNAADAAAAAALKESTDAKAASDAASAITWKISTELKAAEKALADASWRAKVAAQKLSDAEKAFQQKGTPENQKLIDEARAASELASAALRSAEEAAAAVRARHATAQATSSQAKARSDEALAGYRKAAAAAAAAAKEKGAADAAAAAAAKSASWAAKVAQDKAAETERATAALEGARQGLQSAEGRLSSAAQAERTAREKYNAAYTKNESYQISVKRSEQEELSDEQKLYAAALWAKVPEGNYWTAITVAFVRRHLASLEKARDVNDWCPGYWSASEHHREVCWLRLFGGLVKFESSFKPDDAFREPSGAWSVGLLALSPKECRNADSVEMLKQPLLNLSCGIGKFAALLDRHGYIAGPSNAMGAAAYWSTLRPPYEQEKPDGSGVYKLGKRDEILPFTTSYRNF